MNAYRSAATWIETALGCFAEAAERMPDAAFLAEHAAAHDAPRITGRRPGGERAGARMVAPVARGPRRVTARARELQPQCRTGLEQSDRPVRLYRLDQLGRSLDHTSGPFVDLIEPFDHPIAQKQKARGSVKSGPPFAVLVQWRKTHKTLYSKRCSPMALTVAQSRRHIQFTIRRERLHPLAYVGVTFTGFADTLAGIVGWLS
ncbi:MAG: hypothetical protein EOS81_10670 [Mesorhizobium sp.]|uniref:hypothetical protein n=1 Tax=Mesorhizobium sp. TaxID=1871066 RepID=UPI000FD1ACCB|nr:hypothetical protein EN759_17475 [Mesorhizobium sp. M00.F.Ca.ET.038.03.1.1]RWE99931.1 MAG: hypothetical protein EOS81_10670 [Mesorhizobium sp.]